MRTRPSLFAAGTLMPYGKAGFLPDTPAEPPAPATGSLSEAAGKPVRRMLAALARFVDWVMEGAERARRRELERYLGKSVDLHDLERRLRELERNRHPIFGSYV